MEAVNQIKERTEDLFDDLTDYVEGRWNLGVLNASEKAANIFSSLVSALVLGVLAVLVLLFTGLGAAWMLGERLNNFPAGFFIVALLYVFLGIILYSLRDNYIKIPLVNRFLKEFYHEN